MPRHSSKWEETSIATIARWALGFMLLVLIAALIIPH